MNEPALIGPGVDGIEHTAPAGQVTVRVQELPTDSAEYPKMKDRLVTVFPATVKVNEPPPKFVGLQAGVPWISGQEPDGLDNGFVAPL